MTKKKQKPFVQEYPLAVYPISVVVYVGEGLQDYLNDNFKPCRGDSDKDVFLIPQEGVAATCIEATDKNGDYTIIIGLIKDDIGASVMAHEATHAALCVFDFVHAEPDYENQEPFAYLVGYITKITNLSYYKWCGKTSTDYNKAIKKKSD